MIWNFQFEHTLRFISKSNFNLKIATDFLQKNYILMAPRQELNNQVQVQPQAPQNVRDYLQEYINAGYTEEMYRRQTGEIFRILVNHYEIENPDVLVNRLNSYRNVLIAYSNNIPLFELQAFGI